MKEELINSNETIYKNDLEVNIHFDAIIVHGAGIKQRKNGSFHPGFFGKMRTIAGAEAYRIGLADNLIFTGGKTMGKDNPSEAESMNYLTTNFYKKDPKTTTSSNEPSKFSSIPTNVIYLEEESKDTSDNLLKIIKLCQEKGWRKIGYITNEFHIPRTMQLAKNLGLELVPISAENILIKRSSKYKHLIEKLG